MTSKSSRWAVDDAEDATVAAERKKEREEKRRLKEERTRKIANAATSAAPSGSDAQAETSTADERPSKRRRTSHSDPEQPQNAHVNSEETTLLTLPNRGFGPAASVSQYTILNPIEEGSYGHVSRARSDGTGDIVALKKLKMGNNQDGFPVTALREIQTLRACSHPHIVGLREVVLGDSLSDVYIVLDFLEHDLQSLLQSLQEPFLPSEVKTLILQLTSAVSYLHSHFILHRDLKSSNVLLSNRGSIKLADFGMARDTSNPPPRLTQLVVTLWYRAPELLLGTEEYGFEIDMWSLGCIFAELLTLIPLFQGQNEVSQLSLIFSLLGTPTRNSWPGFHSLPNAKALYPLLSNTKSKESQLNSSKLPYLSSSGLQLISSLLALNPSSRPTAEEALDHPYFSEDPRPKPKEMMPTFPSKAGLEKRRKIATPQAPARGEAPKFDEKDLAGLFAGQHSEMQGAGFALKMN